MKTNCNQNSIFLPLISVIIPTHNRINTIRRSIDSVLNQTYSNIELIIVDDCSSDNTQDFILEHYNDFDNILYVINEHNVGPAASRNIGASYANGEYIAFHDSDDVWVSDKLEKQMRLFDNADSTVGMIYSQMHVHASADNTGDYPFKEMPMHLKSGDIYPTLLYQPLIGAPTMLIRKNNFHAIGGFDENLKTLEDYEFSIRFAYKYQILLCDEPLVNIYESPKSIGKQNDEKIRTLVHMMKKFVNDYKAYNLQEAKMTSVFNESILYNNLPILEESLSLLGNDPIYLNTYYNLKSML